MQETAVVWNGIKEQALGMRKMMTDQLDLLTLVVICVEGHQTVGLETLSYRTLGTVLSLG